MTAGTDKPVRVVVVAICGYGASYVRELLDAPADRGVEFVGAVDPYAERSSLYGELIQRGVPIFVDLAAFYASAAADLVVIASPIHHHKQQTLTALASGSGVLCEKPAAATIQDVREMAAAAEGAGRPVAIGFQRSLSSAKALACWPRAESYYTRNDWAGRLKAEDGAWVLDSPINNATAHFLHHMLYVLGPAADHSATPVEVQAELVRAKPIENFDTGVVRVRTECGAEVVFLTTHSTRRERGPVIAYEFERATGLMDADGDKSIVVTTAEGERID
ncbi:MAG: Gfo/Idh/MocA family protein, partial [Planctomycetota bacterium]